MYALQAHRAQVESVIRAAITVTVPAERIGHIEITEREDSTGDEAFFIDVFLKDLSGNFGGSVYLTLINAVRLALIEIGEQRFPFIRVRFEAVAA